MTAYSLRAQTPAQTRAQTALPFAAAPSQAPAGHGLDAAFDLTGPGVRMSFARNEEIFGEGEPSDFVYRVLSGAVRTYRILADGRRQICDFHLEGDCFGLDYGLEHRTTAEALSDTVVLVLRRAALSELARRDNDVARALWMTSVDGLQRSQDHILMLGRKNAAERVASFLIDYAARSGARDEFELPMSRQDIADYLGLTIETVSRTFSQLEGSGSLKAHNSRRIRLTDRLGLEALCE